MKKRRLLLLIGVISVTCVLAYFITKPTLQPTTFVRVELPDNVSLNTPIDWNQTKSLGSEEEGRLVAFQGKNCASILTYISLKDAEMTYGTKQLDQIIQFHLGILKNVYGEYKLEEDKIIQVSGHDARTIKISYATPYGKQITIQALWICTVTDRFFSFSITASESFFENSQKVLENILNSVTCH